MNCKTLLLLISISIIQFSCWKFRTRNVPPDVDGYPAEKVWGYKPVYKAEDIAKKILYQGNPAPVREAGNIYAFRKYIFQVDPGYGIHVIDNSIPADAKRIGFITVLGCSQISIKNDRLYTNNYDDLVVLDFSDLNNIREVSRAKAVFTEYRNYSPLARPPGHGYYECPDYGKFVVEWKRDSVFQRCFN